MFLPEKRLIFDEMFLQHSTLWFPLISVPHRSGKAMGAWGNAPNEIKPCFSQFNNQIFESAATFTMFFLTILYQKFATVFFLVFQVFGLGMENL